MFSSADLRGTSGAVCSGFDEHKMVIKIIIAH